MLTYLIALLEQQERIQHEETQTSSQILGSRNNRLHDHRHRYLDDGMAGISQITN